MGFKIKAKKYAQRCLSIYRHKMKLWAEYKKIKDKRRVNILSEVNLTDEQKKLIDDLYITHYGKKIPYAWHRYYTAYTGHFDPYYIPETLFIPEFESYMNKAREYVDVLADKNILEVIAKGVGVQMPKTIISCANGTLRNNKYELISWDDILSVVPGGMLFAKPTVDSGSGEGCRLLNKEQDNFVEELKTMGSNFVIQEKITCSNSIRNIYPESVNTFRVITYIWKEKVMCTPVILRIGQKGSFLDNAHAGGMFIAVNNDGTLHKTAFTEFRNIYEEHPDTHLIFENYKIENFEVVLQAAKKMHGALPQLGVVNWDFTINQEEIPVLIEANTIGGSIWLAQMAWGKGFFGDNTPEILEWLREKNKEKC